MTGGENLSLQSIGHPLDPLKALLRRPWCKPPAGGTNLTEGRAVGVVG